LLKIDSLSLRHHSDAITSVVKVSTCDVGLTRLWWSLCIYNCVMNNTADEIMTVW